MPIKIKGNMPGMGSTPSQAVMWDAKPAKEVPPVWGGYPKGWLEWAKRVMVAVSNGLHMCSGGLCEQPDAIRVDVRLQQFPDVVSDATNLPFPDDCFAWALIDPPYSQDYADSLYNTDSHYPSPRALVKEAARVSTDVIALLHFTVPFAPQGWKINAVYGVTQGPGYAIRAFTVMRPK